MKHIVIFLVFPLIFMACAKETQCPPCDNGGTCIDGSCACVGLWMGPNCTEQITPTWIFIDRVILTQMPETNAGSSWDLTSGPDLYITIKQSGVEKFSTITSPVTNGAAGASWTGQINLTAEPVTIELWDADDFDNDDYMGGVITSIYSSDNGFPQQIDIGCGNCVVSFSFTGIQYL